MRPLNRPMFRNGGPIKEGIMSGMQDRPGYSVAGRVGGFFTNLFKKSAPTGTVAASQTAKKPSVVGAGFNKIKELFTGSTKTVPKQGPTGVGTPKITKDPITGQPMTRETTRITPGTVTTTGNLQPFTPGGPTNPNIFAAAQRVLVPATAMGGKVLSAAKPYSGVITIGGIGAYSLLNDDGTQKTIDQIKTETGASETEIASAINEANKGGEGGINRDAEIEANRQRYYKLMGIDKMNKDAVYNTLIDASNQIREGGTIKDQLKSGNLVSGVINALSKNLDKSVDLKKQIDAAILKGEITKDINKQKDQLDAEYKRTVIDKARSDMAGGTMNQIINDRKAKGMVTSGQDLFKLAVQTGNASNIKEIISDKAVSNYFKDNPTKTAADFFQEEIVLKLAEEGKSVTPGDYIVGENILRVTADGKIQFVF